MAYLTFRFEDFEADHHLSLSDKSYFVRILANSDAGEGRIWIDFAEKADILALLARVEEAFKKHHFFERGEPLLDGFYRGRPVWIVDNPDKWAYEGGPFYVDWGGAELSQMRKDSSYVPAYAVPMFPMTPPPIEEKIARAVQRRIERMIDQPYTYCLGKFMKRTLPF